MTNPRWARVREIFNAALERPDGREAFVADAAAGDEDVERGVLTLLDAYAETGILPRLDPGGAPTPDDAALSTSAPDLIERSRGEDERRIGYGGMAAVFLANDVRTRTSCRCSTRENRVRTAAEPEPHPARARAGVDAVPRGVSGVHRGRDVRLRGLSPARPPHRAARSDVP